MPTIPPIVRLGTSFLKTTQKIVRTLNSQICILDKLADNSLVCRTLDANGTQLSQVTVPSNTEFIAKDSAGSVYCFVFNSTAYSVVKTDGTTLSKTLPTKYLDKNVTIGVLDGVETLVVLKTRVGNSSYLVNLATFTATPLALSLTSASDQTMQTATIRNNKIYTYSTQHRQILCFSSTGQLVARYGAAGSPAPAVTFPGENVVSLFDVSENGDIYLAKEQNERINAANTLTTRFAGQETYFVKWNSASYTFRGGVAMGGYFYVLDDKALVRFPNAVLDEGNPTVTSFPVEFFALDYAIVNPAVPYKMFVGANVDLSISFKKGIRSISSVYFRYECKNSAGIVVASDAYPLTLPLENLSAEFVVPLTLNLPKLGSYVLRTSVAVDATSEPELEHINFITRIKEDANRPVPAQGGPIEDAAMHKAVGFGLFRVCVTKTDYNTPAKQAVIAAAVALDLSILIQLTDKPDATPAFFAELETLYPGIPKEYINEPDIQGISPENYAVMLNDATAAIKAVSPSAIVVGPAECSINFAWMTRFFNAGGRVDQLSAHAYQRHNSIDTAYWTRTWKALRQMWNAKQPNGVRMMDSEHGYLGNFAEQFLRFQWQAHCYLLKYEACAQAGMTANDIFPYYLKSHGYGGFPSYIVDGNSECYMAATVCRVRAQMLDNRAWDAALTFDGTGPLNTFGLLIGNRYNSTINGSDLLTFTNTGSTEPLQIVLNVAGNCTLYDAEGNPLGGVLTGKFIVNVTQFTSYLEVPHGAVISIACDNFQNNLAPISSYTSSDSTLAAAKAKLSNNLTEFDYLNEMGTTAAGVRGNFPSTLTQTFADAPETAGAILVSNYADNYFCALLNFKLERETAPGVWETVSVVQEDCSHFTLKRNENLTPCRRFSSYTSPHYWRFFWPQSPTLSLRWTFYDATNGQYLNDDLYDEVWLKAFAKTGSEALLLVKRVDIREIMVFETAEKPDMTGLTVQATDATRPEVTGTPILAADGVTMSIPISEVVSGSTGFVPTVAGTPRSFTVAGTGNTRTITLLAAAYQGESVALGYSGGDVADDAGNPLVTFSHKVVTNGSMVPVPVVPVTPKRRRTRRAGTGSFGSGVRR